MEHEHAIRLWENILAYEASQQKDNANKPKLIYGNRIINPNMYYLKRGDNYLFCIHIPEKKK